MENLSLYTNKAVSISSPTEKLSVLKSKQKIFVVNTINKNIKTFFFIFPSLRPSAGVGITTGCTAAGSTRCRL